MAINAIILLILAIVASVVRCDASGFIIPPPAEINRTISADARVQMVFLVGSLHDFYLNTTHDFFTCYLYQHKLDGSGDTRAKNSFYTRDTLYGMKPADPINWVVETAELALSTSNVFYMGCSTTRESTPKTQHFYSSYVNLTNDASDPALAETADETARVAAKHGLTPTPPGWKAPATHRLHLAWLSIGVAVGLTLAVMLAFHFVSTGKQPCACLPCLPVHAAADDDDASCAIELRDIGGRSPAQESRASSGPDDSFFESWRRDRRARRNSGDSFACATVRAYDRAMTLPLPPARLPA